MIKLTAWRERSRGRLSGRMAAGTPGGGASAVSAAFLEALVFMVAGLVCGILWPDYRRLSLGLVLVAGGLALIRTRSRMRSRRLSPRSWPVIVPGLLLFGSLMILGSARTGRVLKPDEPAPLRTRILDADSKGTAWIRGAIAQQPVLQSLASPLDQMYAGQPEIAVPETFVLEKDDTPEPAPPATESKAVGETAAASRPDLHTLLHLLKHVAVALLLLCLPGRIKP